MLQVTACTMMQCSAKSLGSGAAAFGGQVRNTGSLSIQSPLLRRHNGRGQVQASREHTHARPCHKPAQVDIIFLQKCRWRCGYAWRRPIYLPWRPNLHFTTVAALAACLPLSILFHAGETTAQGIRGQQLGTCGSVNCANKVKAQPACRPATPCASLKAAFARGPSFCPRISRQRHRVFPPNALGPSCFSLLQGPFLFHSS